MSSLNFDNSFYREMEGFYASCNPDTCTDPQLIYLNTELCDELNLGIGQSEAKDLANWFSGNTLPAGANPLAQAYAGHQFGQFNPQLGDGRAHILGELCNSDGARFDLCLKGSGRTPFSRGGDGKAALGPMLREVLISEAMHVLHIPTTRSLAVVSTGETVFRESVLPGAVLTRTASSHIRIGTFEFFAARQLTDEIRKLADYCINRHYPEIADKPDKYFNFLECVIERQALLVAQWMGVGFIHGVMNTDNITISGETIDFGPCAFMEAYNPSSVFSSIDHQGRYAYRNQPAIAQWNLARLAECMIPLIDPQSSESNNTAVELVTSAVESFSERYHHAWLEVFRLKLGLDNKQPEDEDESLISDYLTLMEINKVDFTQGFRFLADYLQGNKEKLYKLFIERSELENWLNRWNKRLTAVVGYTTEATAQSLNQNNPRIIPRNHLVEEALGAASEKGNLEPFHALLKATQNPYTQHSDDAKFEARGAEEFTERYQTFCGT